MGHRYSVPFHRPKRMAGEAADGNRETLQMGMEVVVEGLIKNNTNGSHILFQDNKDWFGRIEELYPRNIVKRGSRSFVHVAQHRDKAAVVYAGCNVHSQVPQMNCAWLLAWSVQLAHDGCNTVYKVYVEAGNIINYIKVNWDDIEGKLDISSTKSRYVDQSSGCEASAEITGDGGKATITAVFNNANMDVVQEATGPEATMVSSMPLLNNIDFSSVGENSRRSGIAEFVVRGLIKNNTNGNHLVLHDVKHWCGRLDAPYPRTIVKRGSGSFVHVAQHSSNKAAIVYVGCDMEGVAEMNCAWLLAWSVDFSEDCNTASRKVYVEAGKIVNYIGISWDDIQAKLDQSVDESRYLDKATRCQAFANIFGHGKDDIELVAVFDNVPYA